MVPCITDAQFRVLPIARPQHLGPGDQDFRTAPGQLGIVSNGKPDEIVLVKRTIAGNAPLHGFLFRRSAARSCRNRRRGGRCTDVVLAKWPRGGSRFWFGLRFTLLPARSMLVASLHDGCRYQRQAQHRD